ncbi:hypothetical protein KKH23_05410 [Patescibacteria group bacterium]|nr:hypothetical protein [Patescibacteria group bacterium]
MVEPREVTPEPPAQEAVPGAVYDLHIKVPEEMRSVLKDAAELAFRMENIPKPDLVNLMNLFIGWGMTVLKQKWLDRSGYR